MTPDHDLLARIDAAIEKRKQIYGTIGTRSPEVPRVLTDYHNTGISFLLALRAVVELHKPFNIEFNRIQVEHCRCFDFDGTNNLYPCPTIQAIEKELR